MEALAVWGLIAVNISRMRLNNAKSYSETGFLEVKVKVQDPTSENALEP